MTAITHNENQTLAFLYKNRARSFISYRQPPSWLRPSYRRRRGYSGGGLIGLIGVPQGLRPVYRIVRYMPYRLFAGCVISMRRFSSPGTLVGLPLSYKPLLILLISMIIIFLSLET